MKNGNKKHGAVFTPMDVARKMAASFDADTLKDPTKTVLDPTCGSGNLLFAVCERRLALGVDPVDIANTTHGFDIQEHYVDECRERLERFLGVPCPHIKHKDFLA